MSRASACNCLPVVELVPLKSLNHSAAAAQKSELLSCADPLEEIVEVHRATNHSALIGSEY